MNISNIISAYRGGGTSAYNLRMMLKCWILGFVNRIYSCRFLTKELRENLSFIWISGNQQPDFHTLNYFRLRLKDEANSNQHKIVWKKQVDNQLEKIEAELDELFKRIDKINWDEKKNFLARICQKKRVVYCPCCSEKMEFIVYVKKPQDNNMNIRTNW
jgi:hypothetical protein